MSAARPSTRRQVVAAVIVLVVALLALAADRAALVFAQRWSAEQIAAATDGSGVAVHIDGFPFLNQLARRNISSVVVTATSMRGEGLTLTDVTLHGSRVQLASSTSVTAGALDGTALISYPVLAQQFRLAEGSLGYAGSGLLRVSTSIDLFGTKVSVVATGTLTVAAGKATFRPTAAALGSGTNLDPTTLSRLVITAPVPELLPGLAVTSAAPASNGVRVQIDGSNVTLNR